MANNNIEKYLEAMLAVLNGDNPPDVPTPSWNIEKYLAAILTSLENGGGGSGGGVLVVHDVNGTLDKTWQEIHDAMLSGGAVIETDGSRNQSVTIITEVDYDKRGGEYGVLGKTQYTAFSADGYPVSA